MLTVIVTTYNRPAALGLVLQALTAQPRGPLEWEVIIADDGSSAATTDFIRSLQPSLPYPLQHVWQEDLGFRAARARNRALAVATGDYLIFLDGDCIPQRDFLVNHSRLAERGWWVTGHRILLSERLTLQVVTEQLPLWSWSVTRWWLAYMRRDINRLLPLLKFPAQVFRKRHPDQWSGAKTCNLGVWREDLLKINGFDERFEGWGHEDADLVVRLLRSGVRRKTGRFAIPVLHLWHPQEDRSRERDNWRRLEERLNSTEVVAKYGVNQYLG